MPPEAKTRTKEIAPIREAPVLTDNEIQDAVDFINEKANKTVYQGYAEIGKYILEKFFEDDIELATSKNPLKHTSFRKLADREDLVLHANTLSIAVKVAAQEQFFLDNKLKTEKMTYTHKAEFTKLKNADAKVEMVNKCREEGWTSRRLIDEIKKIKKEKGEVKYSATVVMRQINNKVRTIANPDLISRIPDVEALGAMRPTTKEKVRAGLDENLKEIEEAQARLNKMRDKCKNLKIAMVFQEKQAKGQIAKPKKNTN